MLTYLFAKVWFWVLVLFVFFLWGIATDPSRKKMTRSDLAEEFVNDLQQERGRK